MRRIPFPSAALAAGLVVLLTGCAGETPTSPTSSGGGGGNGGSCAVVIAMVATSQTPVVGTEVVVRAAVTKSGAAVADGTSVLLSTDLGLFAENGLQTVSKTTLGGAADVTLYSVNPGPAHVKATYDCGSASITVTYAGAQTLGPYVSSFQPQSGSCAGGDSVTFLGGLFGTSPGSVFFGGSPASIVSWSNASITVTTPAHALKNSLVPETVNVVIVAAGGQTAPVTFTYFCVAQRMSIASLSPIAGSPSGGDAVVILGSHFGTNIATTQVTFCGLPAQVTGVSDVQINVTTPAHTLANTAVSESCPVVVTRDLGLVSVQAATSPTPFVYKGSGATGTCNTDPTFYVSSLTPNTGPPDGGTVVTITGNGFPASASLLLVTFGGNPGVVTSSNPNGTTIQVSTPRRVLASPTVPETVDVVVTDLGSASQRCYRVAGGFVYTAQALDPSFYSVSPRTGPNDQATRTTAFGANFQFPMQVFMTGGNCGAQRVEAPVISVLPSQIVFNTPIAVGGNACLAGQLVDVVILNPATGKTANCPGCFKYYACPTAGVASPSVGSATQSTTVVITGNNFAEPVVANYRLATSTATPVASLNVTNVSNTSIIVTLPPLQTLLGGALSCTSTAGFIDLTFPGLACNSGTPLSVPFTYNANPPTATAASPSNLSQDGSAFPATGSPATITVTGTNFAAPVTVALIKDGSLVSNTPVNTANVSNPTSLSFTAPAVPAGSFNKNNCGLGGVMEVPTSFGIRITNTLTGCSVDLPNVLLYNPTDTTCHASVSITTTSPLTAGVNNSPYTTTFAATGGTTPYTWALSGSLPAGMSPASLAPTTGVFSGTPTATGTYVFTVTVTDALSTTDTKTFSWTIN
ncbi:MAG TPA: IPT/TIG domain-containing protein [Thermoanaerobaculia bacterium]|nr:IPT/TIG domain-containing protein [Thermoanaerobaculia bacterium]